VPIIPDALRTFAEEPESTLPEPRPPASWIKTPRFVLAFSPTPTQSILTSVRTTAEELDGLIAEVRGLVRSRNYTRNVWVVGPSCRPEGLARALEARGFRPAVEPPYEPEMTAMALASAPPPGPPSVEARRVRNFEEYLQAMKIAVSNMGDGEDDAGGGWLAAAEAFWAQENGPAHLTQIAIIDGRIVGFGFSVASPAGLMLGGAAGIPEFRGRGAYRALVAARWSDAVSLGTPALVIQAGAMSRPILERCGFTSVCRLLYYQDPEIK
jgi:GNAT superfamily N-acetyltransferase